MQQCLCNDCKGWRTCKPLKTKTITTKAQLGSEYRTSKIWKHPNTRFYVLISKETSLVFGSRMQSKNDPHMTTIFTFSTLVIEEVVEKRGCCWQLVVMQIHQQVYKLLTPKHLSLFGLYH